MATIVAPLLVDDSWGGGRTMDWSSGEAGLPESLPYNMSVCGTGPSELEQHCLLDTGLSAQDVTDITLAWRQTMVAAMQAVHQAGGWVWQLFATNDVVSTRGSNCTAQYQAACTAGSHHQTKSMFYPLTIPRHSPGDPIDPASDVAKFLLLRGPFGWLGTGWVGCVDGWFKLPQYNETYGRPTAFDMDAGLPVDQVCKETSPGVFSRAWTKVIVQHSCVDGKSSIKTI